MDISLQKCPPLPVYLYYNMLNFVQNTPTVYDSHIRNLFFVICNNLFTTLVVYTEFLLLN